MSQVMPLTPEIIGRALDNAKLTPALKFIIGVAAAGFLFDSFDITIVAYALPKIRQEFKLTPQEVGLAGSAAIALLILTTLHHTREAVAYLGVFGVGTIAGMMLIAVALVQRYAVAALCGVHGHLCALEQ